MRPLVALVLLASLPRLVRAQDSTAAAPARDEAVCLGFAFGAWTPKLDWKGVGQPPITHDPALDRAPGGRDWAAPAGTVPDDSTLLLFPAWWPAGVAVTLANRAPAVGDTVTGRAVALVPRADIEAPRSRVRAWRVRCR